MRLNVALLLVVLSVFCFAGCSGQPANTDAANSAEPSPTPQYADAATAMADGTRLFDENDLEGAIAAFEAAVGMQSDLAEGYFKLGVSYSLLERQQLQSGTAPPDSGKKPRSESYFEKAVEAYKTIVKAEPENDAALFNLGRSYGRLYKDEEAEKELTKAVKLRPNDSDYQMELGSTLIRLAKYREAVTALKKAIEIEPDSERLAELLEEAEAGVKRVNFQMPKKDGNVAKGSTPANASADDDETPASGTPGANSRQPASNNRPAPPANTRPPATPRPSAAAPSNPTRPRTVDKRGNPSN